MIQRLTTQSLAERLVYYRQLAETALKNAQCTSNTDIRASYITMAAGWHALAAELDEFLKTRSDLSSQAQDGPQEDPAVRLIK